MTRNPRYRLLTLALAGFMAGAVVPFTLCAQSAPSQSYSSRHAKKSKKSAEAKAKSSAASAAKSTKAEAQGKKESALSRWRHNKQEAKSSATGSASKAEAKTMTHETVASKTPPSPGMVWVNTSSKVYHKAGSKWYGKTKHGKWMSEADAEKAGYKAAKN